MAMENSGLEGLIVKYLKDEGFTTEGAHAYAGKMARAFGKAVVEYIQNNAEVNVTGGSSSGTYKVK